MAPTAVTEIMPSTPSSTQDPSQAQSVPNLFALNGKTIAITGGGRGLGLSLAFAVIEAGGHVACLDILPAPSVQEWTNLQKLANASNLTASYHQCDVTSEIETTNTLETIAQEATAKGAPFLGIVACAGIQQQVPALDYDAQDLERILRGNVTGSFLTAKRAARIFVDQKQGGSIVLIASMSGQIANRVCRA
jgi:NAD(P)-dependent dehydrogenase (short-subunit alcohol dehydrogenase family)